MKNIKSIYIENIKGIEKFGLELNLLPFMPNFFVAPNGYGKSSIAIGFNSLNRNRIALDKNNFHKNLETNEPLIRIEITNDDNSVTIFIANKDENQISKEFDIFVINNQIIPEANPSKINGTSIYSPSLEIPDIYIIENIPEKRNLEYQISKFKKSIDDNRLIWTDIYDFLENKYLICKIFYTGILDKLTLSTPTKKVDNFIKIVKDLKGSNSNVVNYINANYLYLLDFELFNNLTNEVKKFDKENKSEAEILLISIQILKTFSDNKILFKEVAKFYNYNIAKERILELYKAFELNKWKEIKPHEIPIKKKGKIIKKHFGITFPSANHISNGERDVISFIGLLLKAEFSFNKKRTILIIDEVFDYLDDANLIAVQYYITRFINFHQKREVEFFPIILTHLNPYYFKNYFFSKQKVHYLKYWKGNVNRDIENLVISRNNCPDKNYQNTISEYFLHFNPNSIDFSSEIKTELLNQKLNNTNSNIFISSNFIQSIFLSLDSYIKGKKSYDPISVCIATRIKIEQIVYNKLLTSDLKNQFIQTKMTVNKLDFAKEFAGIKIPEIFYLLGTVYNEIIHVKKNIDNSSPIYLKLDNLTIQKMIEMTNTVDIW